MVSALEGFNCIPPYNLGMRLEENLCFSFQVQVSLPKLGFVSMDVHPGLPRILQYALKVIYQTINLFWTIFLHTKKPSHVLMQVSISIPITSRLPCYIVYT